MVKLAIPRRSRSSSSPVMVPSHLESALNVGSQPGELTSQVGVSENSMETCAHDLNRDGFMPRWCCPAFTMCGEWTIRLLAHLHFFRGSVRSQLSTPRMDTWRHLRANDPRVCVPNEKFSASRWSCEFRYVDPVRLVPLQSHQVTFCAQGETRCHARLSIISDHSPIE